ncbi:MAG: hypothetical protein PHN49_00915 [Candidatus Omnitrophica bacterium]|nr:hypothetical protein [Candidatus Omnitrophota bacterium]MDD5670184.1 hypothetical protein [Candidatus Omnitrophota bacterium]
MLQQYLPKLRAGDIYALDRYYVGANLYACYKQADFEFITRDHQNLEIGKLKIVTQLTENDLIVKMSVNPQHRRQVQSLPEFVITQIIQTKARVRARKEKIWIATSLLDSECYPSDEIRAWCQKRWKVGGFIEEFNIWLGADVLRSKNAQGAFKRLHARMIALNLIHWLILKAAKKHDKLAERLSVSSALRLTAVRRMKMSTAPIWQRAALFEDLLDSIAFSEVSYRQNRIEPRMTKRETKHYDMLKISRAEWKSLYAIAA